MGGAVDATVLVIEDEANIRLLLRTIFDREGITVVEAADGQEGLRCLYSTKADLVLLDVAMPEMDGWETLQRIRELSEVPVLILTASGGEMEKVRGLRGGADDYLTKPFGRQELLARVEALLRRDRAVREAPEGFADEFIEIDFAQRRVTVSGQEMGLTPTEFKLLTVLTRHPKQVLSQDQLLEHVWGSSRDHSRDQVKLYVSYLRRKFTDAGVDPVETVRGFGYRYQPRAAPHT